MIAITGGGTGGHLRIAKVINKELIKREIKTIYIGSTYGADRKWFENSNEFSAKYFLDSSGVVDKKGIKKLFSLMHILKLTKKAKEILNKHNIIATFSVGGYSAAPASFASINSLFIHEQNAYIGNLNKILKPFSKIFFNTFLYNDPYPVEEEFFNLARVRKDLKTVIFLGGSQGAKAINDFALSIAKDLAKNKINIIHQTGEKDFNRVKEFYEKNEIDAEIFSFSNKIYEKIAKADFAISRAGASTLFELASNQIPTLFIPYPYAANDHQYHNANYLASKNLALLKRENELNRDILDTIFNLNLEKISKNLEGINSKDGAKIIVDRMLDVLSI